MRIFIKENRYIRSFSKVFEKGAGKTFCKKSSPHFYVLSVQFTMTPFSNQPEVVRPLGHVKVPSPYIWLSLKLPV